jgi:hypothetical protein
MSCQGTFRSDVMFWWQLVTIWKSSYRRAAVRPSTLQRSTALYRIWSKVNCHRNDHSGWKMRFNSLPQIIFKNTFWGNALIVYYVSHKQSIVCQFIQQLFYVTTWRDSNPDLLFWSLLWWPLTHTGKVGIFINKKPGQIAWFSLWNFWVGRSGWNVVFKRRKN